MEQPTHPPDSSLLPDDACGQLFFELGGAWAFAVRIEQYTAPDPVTDADGVADMGHSWAAWFIDPSGNVLAVVEPKAPTAAS